MEADLTLADCARNATDSLYPELWQGLAGAWVPALGCQGGQLVDVSGRGNGATGGGTWNPGCLTLNGSSQSMAVDSKMPGFLSGANATGVTLFARIRHTATTARYCIFGEYQTSPATLGFNVFVNSTYNAVLSANKIEFSIFDSSTTTDCMRIGTSSAVSGLNDGTWKSLACVSLPGLKDAGSSIYVNGISLALDALGADGSVTPGDFAYAPRIGARGISTGAERYYPGDISHVMLFSRALSSGEIALLSADPLAPFRRRKQSVYAVIGGTEFLCAVTGDATAGVEIGGLLEYPSGVTVTAEAAAVLAGLADYPGGVTVEFVCDSSVSGAAQFMGVVESALAAAGAVDGAMAFTSNVETGAAAAGVAGALQDITVSVDVAGALAAIVGAAHDMNLAVEVGAVAGSSVAARGTETFPVMRLTFRQRKDAYGFQARNDTFKFGKRNTGFDFKA